MMIKTQAGLQDLCTRLKGLGWITVDTEFLRDKTYYPKLCLIQVAGPEGEPYAIDPLAAGLDLAPFLELLADESILKVFHAARQDLEIFYNITEAIPHPIFDTQVAAMVCGYGEQVGYGNIVRDVCRIEIDKGAQFTDWSRRPLSERQLSYALDDVTYLRQVYLHLAAMLEKRGRTLWVAQEMDILTNPVTYQNDPNEAWQRIKVKTTKPKVMAVLKEISAWREREAQRRDVPRGRILRDETLADIAVHPPENEADLKAMRGVGADMAGGKYGGQILEAVQKGLKTPPDQCPRTERKAVFPANLTPALEMLKMLLRIQASEHQVAAKLIADSADLEALAMNDAADILALKGWRYEVFGHDAIALKHGKIALSLENGQIRKKTV